jgi:citrate lyase subunit beta/citryl-CoA lyase
MGDPMQMRSLLFAPADSDRKMAKAMGAGADVVILDLEDSIATDGKVRAREVLREFLATALAAWAPGQPRIYVRINDFATPFWQGDLAALGSVLPHGILLPKARSGEDVHQLSVGLDHAEEKSKVPSGRTRILTLVTEVAVSVLQLPSYIGSSSRLEGMTWGAEDLSAEIGATANREPDGSWTSPYRLVRDLALMTATAAQVPAIDTVYVDYRNPTGLALEAAVAARDGFVGKLAIHPAQVPIINEAFTPAPAEIERAKAVIAAFEAAGGAGTVGFEGRMLDRPHLVQAKRTLARAGIEVPPPGGATS